MIAATAAILFTIGVGGDSDCARNA